ncbi:hypothetical protein [Flavobacterium ajazii]|uniref:hypothetical protein n=1 Tax=Flavobacterium ajazii TaxID=2692318 RepID=UPI0013D30C6D|nr:hypothetical protein [Flavobacterium ajazii]
MFNFPLHIEINNPYKNIKPLVINAKSVWYNLFVSKRALKLYPLNKENIQLTTKNYQNEKDAQQLL